MRSGRSALAIIVLALQLFWASAARGDTTATALPEPDAPYRDALAPLGLAPSDLRVDMDMVEVFGQDRFRLPIHDLLARDARRAPGVAEALRDHALEAAKAPSEAVLFTMSRIQARVRRSLVGDPIADLARMAAEPGALAEAVVRLRQAGGAAEPKPQEVFALRQQAAALPPRVAEGAALVLLAETRFLGWRERAFASLPEREQEGLVNLAGLFTAEAEGAAPAGAGSAWPPLEAAGAKVEMNALAAGAFDVVLAIERALPMLREGIAAAATATATPSEQQVFHAETPFGAVEIDPRPLGTTHTADAATLLLIDLAGDDRYEGAGAARGPRAPVSVAIDLAGDDVYDTGGPSLGHTFGAGILGLGVLVDAAGNDRYRAGSLSLGAGLLGIGLLADLGGDDAYDGETYVEGAAAFGAGALVDSSGRDRYRCMDRGQGFGGVLGAGLLVDGAGDDRYEADDRDIRRPSAQSREHNASMAQGAASGVRMDFIDGRSLAGGFGMLADGAGDDAYSAGVFAQGMGFWYGVGILADRSGNDTYDGVWYAQGAAAHFAVGILHDGGGDDRYRGRLDACQGHGHDYSLGFLYDAGGDDVYEAPPLSLGAGNGCGVGVLVDRSGKDRYTLAAGATAADVLGVARTYPNKPYDLRRWGRTLGVFIDLGGGKDAYPEGRGGDGRAWRDAPEADLPDDLSARGALGTGLDR